MKKTIFAIALLVLSSGRAQIVQQVIATSPVQAAGCSPTLLTGAANDWQFWNPEVACISTCANGGHITDVPDSIASLNALQSTSSLTPTYTTGGINGLVVGLYNHGAQTRLVTSSPISTGNTTTTWFAVLNPTDFSANGFIIVGNFGSTGNLEWGLGTNGKQFLNKSQITALATGTTVFLTGTWITIVLQYTQSTGAYAFYKCSGGTCTSDGSGTTSAATFSNSVNALGFTSGDLAGDGYIAEIAYYNSITTANFGAYSLCKYGI